jgi:agmatine/peptidylarginine deiminase
MVSDESGVEGEGMSSHVDTMDALREKIEIIWRAWMDAGNRHSEESAKMHREIRLMRAVIQNQAETIMVQARELKALRRKP